MFYIGNVQNWLADIIKQIQLRKLSPDDSTFMIFFFSSLDDEFVKFFKDKREKISSYSGSNFHIFTPIIYDNETIPDSEWLSIREEFEEMGINVGNKPFSIIFKLLKTKEGYIPDYIGVYSINSTSRIDYYLRNIIDLFRMKKYQSIDSAFEIEKITGSRNYFGHTTHYNRYSVLGRIDESIKIPTVFLSHSSKDKDVVKRLRDELIKHNVKVWFDETNILAGDSIRNEIDKGISKSDFCLFIVSDNSVTSDWTKYEVNQFLNAFDKKKIIPILLDKSINKLSDTLMSLKELKYLDFSDNQKWNENIKELIKSLRAYYNQ